MAGHIATAKDVSWTTPKKVVDLVWEMFGGPPALDPCSNEHSIVRAQTTYCLPATNGLTARWDFKSIYCNPPYGRCYLHPGTCNYIAENLGKGRFVCMRCLAPLTRKDVDGTSIADWVEKCAHAQITYNAEVLALIPAAVGTAHVQEFVFEHAKAICFIRGRLQFGGAPQEGSANVAPMDTMVPYWGNFPDRFERIFSPLGKVVRL